jgi:hypothetical protein
MFCRLLKRKELSLCVDGKHSIVLLFSGVDDRFRPENPGVVDENVQTPEGLFRFLKQPPNVIDLAHVCLNGPSRPAMGLNAGHDFLCLIRTLRVVDHDGGPILGQPFGNTSSDSARCARHDRYLPFE